MKQIDNIKLYILGLVIIVCGFPTGLIISYMFIDASRDVVSFFLVIIIITSLMLGIGNYICSVADEPVKDSKKQEVFYKGGP